MHLIRTRVVMALTAVMVVVWSSVASGTNGDPISAGQNTTATAQTQLSTTPSSGNGFLVTMSGTSTGAAVKGQNNGSGSGISGITTNPNGFGNISQNTAATHGTGAAGTFGGGQNDGVRGITTNASSFGVKGTNTAGGYGVFSSGNLGVSSGVLVSPIQPLVITVNGTQGFEIEPTFGTPNVIGGFSGNSATPGIEGATISGGGVPGGVNTAGYLATVGGGIGNHATGSDATVGGGGFNTAGGHGATVGGGVANTAGGEDATVGGGTSNTAGGIAATVGGGGFNTAAGSYSYAAGRAATADDYGAFVWADFSPSFFHSNTFPCTGQASCTPTSGVNTFNARATGGVRFVTGTDVSTGDATSGCYISAGGSGWNCVSDRRAKRAFQEVDYRAVLRHLAHMPVTTWSYTSQDSQVRHMGPTAQGFSRAFHLGEDTGTINSIDSAGVALAAIKGLYSELQAERARSDGLRDEVRALKARVAQQRGINTRQDREIGQLHRQVRRLVALTSNR